MIVLASGLVWFSIWLKLAFSGQVNVPQQLNFGFLTVHIYGICIALAMSAALATALYRSEKILFSRQQIENLFVYLIIFGFVGARIFHVFSQWHIYKSQPLEIFAVWHGGLGIYGAIAGGLIALVIFRKIYKIGLPVFQLLDWLVPSLLIGQIIGRFGNFFNYELFGRPTGAVWGMYVPEQFRPLEFFNQQFFTPLFLYEALLNLALLVIILASSSKVNKPGLVFASYLVSYGLIRFFLEFLKIEPILLAGWRINSILALILSATGLVIAIYVIRYRSEI